MAVGVYDGMTNPWGGANLVYKFAPSVTLGVESSESNDYFPLNYFTFLRSPIIFPSILTQPALSQNSEHCDYFFVNHSIFIVNHSIFPLFFLKFSLGGESELNENGYYTALCGILVYFPN
ncbi:hypothetical protein [Dipodfec virus UA23Rod_1661]|uniref:Uncharacterized protein n=1 Tax=Dipodfec virus UA23Rod_1661 TaxID=2929254 RepID=A0A976R8E2_9VIRU|nr:hypothetical protein [Dipodfec virus UA23Rod_1661]